MPPPPDKFEPSTPSLLSKLRSSLRASSSYFILDAVTPSHEVISSSYVDIGQPLKTVKAGSTSSRLGQSVSDPYYEVHREWRKAAAGLKKYHRECLLGATCLGIYDPLVQQPQQKGVSPPRAKKPKSQQVRKRPSRSTFSTTPTSLTLSTAGHMISKPLPSVPPIPAPPALLHTRPVQARTPVRSPTDNGPPRRPEREIPLGGKFHHVSIRKKRVPDEDIFGSAVLIPSMSRPGG